MYKHILIATDGSELATKALEHGLALAKRDNAHVTVVTVTEPWAPLEMAHKRGSIGMIQLVILKRWRQRRPIASSMALPSVEKHTA